MASRFTSLPFFVYPVRDVARARKFYAEVLGLQEIANWQNRWIEYAVGDPAGPVLAITDFMERAQPGAKGGAAALETPVFADVVAHLRAAGVKFLVEPMDTGACHMAWFEDPDGNALMLHEKHAAT